MTTAVLQFSEPDLLGAVAGVDTSRVIVNVSNSALLVRIAIGNLVAIRGATQHEYLIGIAERATRSLQEEFAGNVSNGDDELSLALITRDQIRVAMIGTYRTVDGEKVNTFKRGADSFPQIDRECYFVEGGNLQRFMGLLAQDVPLAERLKLGHFVVDRTAEAIASGDRFFQRHAAILGSTGSGKSWAVATILERASKLKYPNIIVLDMHGEYRPLSRDANFAFARLFRIAGPADLEDIDDEVLFLPYWLLNRDEMLSMLLDRSDQNAPNQASRFTHHVRELKDESLVKAGKEDVRKTFTIDSPIPYRIDGLLARLSHDNTEKGVGQRGAPVKGPWEDKLTRFISRLDAKIEDRRYGFMFKPPKESLEYNWLSRSVTRLIASSGDDAGIKIIDFSEVPSDVLPVVAGTLARLLYDVQFWMEPSSRTPVTLICDEAHLYLPVREDADAVERQALGVFERIAKEGRKYGFSIVAVSQRPSDVSRTILSQCNNFLALRLTNESDQNVIRRLMPDSLAGLTSVLPLLDTGEALLLGDAILLPSRIKLDPPSVQPASGTRDFWRDWATVPPDAGAASRAVESLRSQTRQKN